MAATMTSSFNLFFWWTFGYFMFKYMANGKQWYWHVLYVMVFTLLMYVVNVNVYKDKCGFTDTWTVFKATFLPWTLIFGFLLSILMVYPGWKSPFSNTIGYVFAVLSPSAAELKKLINPQEEFKAMQSDPLLFVNQINMDNLEEVLQEPRYMRLFTNQEAAKQLITDLVFVKECISEFVWFLLTGFVTISTSFNLLTNATCTQSSDQQTQAYNQNVVAEDDPVPAPKRTYFVDE